MSRRKKVSSLIIAIALTFMLLAVACSGGGSDENSMADEMRGEPDGVAVGDDLVEEHPRNLGEPELAIAEPGSVNPSLPPDPSVDNSNLEDETQDVSKDEVEPPAKEDIDTNVVVIDVKPLNLNRDIIKTGTMTIEVDDVLTASAEAEAAIEALGGAVFGQHTVAHETATTVFTFKVLPEDFGKAQTALAQLGDVVERTVSVQDVTDRVVDLESQIATSEASVARLRALLAKATDLNTIVQLEQQLLARETTLETLRGQLRTLDDQVALSTIVLTITEAIEPAPMPAIQIVATAVADGTTVCPGEESLSLSGDTDIMVCIEVTNTGDTTLSGLEVSTTGGDLDALVFEVVSGDETKVEPTDKVVFAATTEVTESALLTASVVATYGDEDTEIVNGRSSVNIDVDRPSTLPGFADAFGRGSDAVVSIFGVALIAIGVLLPFSWLLVPAAVVWAFRRRKGGLEAPAA
ncbi:MAG: DUF4349 domain-containing protein [Acidobacteria bacterium]|nr:DUF4349 domain-containing protein [Acidobacteriota bacterium]